LQLEPQLLVFIGNISETVHGGSQGEKTRICLDAEKAATQPGNGFARQKLLRMMEEYLPKADEKAAKNIFLSKAPMDEPAAKKAMQENFGMLKKIPLEKIREEFRPEAFELFCQQVQDAKETKEKWLDALSYFTGAVGGVVGFGLGFVFLPSDNKPGRRRLWCGVWALFRTLPSKPNLPKRERNLGSWVTPSAIRDQEASLF
jgi:hypothetical protein